MQEMRKRDAHPAVTTWAEGSRERGGGGVDRDGKWGCQAQAMRWLPYHRTPWNPFGNENPPPRSRLEKKNIKGPFAAVNNASGRCLSDTWRSERNLQNWTTSLRLNNFCLMSESTDRHKKFLDDGTSRSASATAPIPIGPRQL